MLHTRNVGIHERAFNTNTLHATHTAEHYFIRRKHGTTWTWLNKNIDRAERRKKILAKASRTNFNSWARFELVSTQHLKQERVPEATSEGKRKREKKNYPLWLFHMEWERACNIAHSHMKHINGNVLLIYRFCAGKLRQSFERESNNSDGSSSSKWNEKIVEMNWICYVFSLFHDLFAFFRKLNQIDECKRKKTAIKPYTRTPTKAEKWNNLSAKISVRMVSLSFFFLFLLYVLFAHSSSQL